MHRILSVYATYTQINSTVVDSC